MNIERLGEMVDASVTTGKPLTAEQVAGVLTDEELITELRQRLSVASAALKAVTTELSQAKGAAPSPEQDKHDSADLLRAQLGRVPPHEEHLIYPNLYNKLANQLD